MDLVAALRRPIGMALAGLLTIAVAACDKDWGDDGQTTYPEDDNRKTGGNVYDQPDSIFGGGGISLFGDPDDRAPVGAGGGGAGIGVNSYLWRASLDTIAFMPLASADPFGGVIITDWYSPPESRSERFKVNLYILGRDLRADGVRAAVFRQALGQNGQWFDAEVLANTPIDLENAILTRARQLRIASLQ